MPLERPSSSRSTQPTPPSNSTRGYGMMLRPRKRKSSPLASTSRNQRRRTTKVRNSVGATSQQRNINGHFQNEDRGEEENERVENSLLPNNARPAIMQSQKVQTNPFGAIGIVTTAATKLSHWLFGPPSAQKLADLAEVAKWKSRYGDAVKANKALKELLRAAKDANVELRQHQEEKMQEMVRLHEDLHGILADKDRTVEALETEIGRMTTTHLETLREIVGRGNYREAHDAGALKRIAMRRARDLNVFLFQARSDGGNMELSDLEPTEERQGGF